MADDTTWDLIESTKSCLQLGKDEQCVEKAVERISSLKKSLSSWRAEAKRNITVKESGRSSRLKTTTRETTASTPTSGVSFYEPNQSNNLVVVGLKTGQVCEETVEWSSMNQMITSIQNLVERLEKDREITVAKWKEERERVIKMRRSLDEKAVERLRILPILVQQEHERFARDLLELKWHISFESRQLKYIKDEVDILMDANNEYQGNLERSADHLELLNDKMDKEGDKMAAIIHRQAETDLELKQSKLELDKATEKTHQTRVRVQGELRRLTKSQDDLLKRLNIAEDALASVLSEQATLKEKCSTVRSKIFHQSGEKNAKLNLLEKLEANREEVENEVQSLLKDMQEQNSRTTDLMKQNEMLKQKEQAVSTSMNDTDASLKKEAHKLTLDLKNTRELTRETIENIDNKKELIEDYLKSLVNDSNAEERASKELSKIDSQMKTIQSQTTTLRSETRDMTEDFKSEEMKLGMVEDDLRSEVHELREDLQKEIKSKITYRGRMQEDKEELEKMAANQEKEEKEMKQKAKDLLAKRRKSLHRATLMESSHQMKYNEEELMKKKLETTRQELERVESTLGGKYSSLFKEKSGLNSEVLEKRNQVSELQQTKVLLQDKVEDTSKSNKMTQKMEADTLAEIEKLECKKNELNALIEEEKLEEDSCKKELHDITKFFRDSKEKFTHYLIEREKYTKQLEIDEIQSAVKNRVLAKEYEGLMDKHMGIKESSLRILEHQLELEAALKDLGQLLALQMKLSTTMTASYQHRSITGMKDLSQYRQDAMHTYRRVQDIRERLDVVLNQMARFLEDCESEQTEIVSARNEIGTAAPTDRNKGKLRNDGTQTTAAIPLVHCRT